MVRAYGVLVGHLTNAVQSTPHNPHSGQIEAEFSFLAHQRLTEAGSSLADHVSHQLVADNLLLMRLDHEDQYATTQWYITFFRSPDGQEREEFWYL